MTTEAMASLADVQAVYSGPEGRLWELIMGEQIHIGGFASSMDLARRAGIEAGWRGVDLCCCTGAGMRFLLRFFGAAEMTGVDATEAMVKLGRQRCEAEGFGGRATLVLGDASKTGLAGGAAGFVWGEDAWCYVVDKPALINEAARLVRPDGVIAFTDWVVGKAGLSASEYERFCRFMKFPNMESIDGYRRLLAGAGCRVEAAEDTGRFAPSVAMYIQMLSGQLTYDALKIIGFDQELLEQMGAEMAFAKSLADAGKLAQGLFVARKEQD